MGIPFDGQRWQHTKENYGKWWAGTLGRPIISVTVGGYDAGRPEPSLPDYGFHSFYEHSVTPAQIVDRWDYDLGTQRYLGDAFPAVFPNFGPGVAAAFIGCELCNAESTVWFHPRNPTPIASLHLAPAASESYLFKRVRDLMVAAVDRWQGLVQVGMTDLGGASRAQEDEVLARIAKYGGA